MNKCSACHHQINTRKIIYTQWYEGKLVAVEDVPAEVCPNCGEEYFSPEVANEVQKAIESQHSTKTLAVPVFHLSRENI